MMSERGTYCDEWYKINLSPMNMQYEELVFKFRPQDRFHVALALYRWVDYLFGLVGNNIRVSFKIKVVQVWMVVCLMKLCCTRWLYFLVGAVGHSSVKGKVC